jgi:preprotein translocase subunit SecF
MSKSFDRGKINFIGLAPALVGVSAAAIVASFVLFATKGFDYGVDFAGGTEIQVKFSQVVEAGKVRQFASDLGLKDASVQSLGAEANEFVVRVASVVGVNDKETTDLLNATIAKVTEGLKGVFQDANPEIRRIDTVGPQIGEELSRSGLLAAFYCVLVILIYVGLRFDFVYAQAAVLCLVHDAIVTLGILSLVGHQVTVQTVAAILTLIGYSLNDTIVIFDRIRENIPQYRDQKLSDVVNLAVNQTWVRSVNTSVTVLLTIVTMYWLAGGAIEDFAFIIGVGVLIGTYSTVYVASPLMIVGQKLLGKAT